MKKIILLGAVLITVTVAFIYVPRAAIAPETISVLPSASISATLKISEKTYPLSVAPGETLIEAMLSLSSRSEFTFTGRDHPGLGFFVDSINGKKNEGGMYWVFYVNGVSATVGASTAEIHTGDVVEWKYKEGY
ncbi:DUF4430 domain-containing protein [Candidatus Kaiserbacteria bacterium]|nr:DUF4430 domain-containing protein [Candidatus Kaiserbacteria bacterium]